MSELKAKYYEDVYLMLLSALKTDGETVSPRHIDVQELLDVKMTVANNETLICLPGVRDVVDKNTNEGKYLRAEFAWYMSGSLSPKFISMFGSMWNKLVNKFDDNKDSAFNGNLNSNYGFQTLYKPSTLFFDSEDVDDMQNLNNMNSFIWCAKELVKDSYSRKAIIQYSWPIIYKEGVNDFTCTQTQQFFDRKDTIYNLVNIRSSDAIKGLTFDMSWWDFLGQCMAQYLGANYAKMSVNIGSSHFYSSDAKLVDSMLDKAEDFKRKRMILNSVEYITSNATQVAENIAKYYRDIINNNDIKGDISHVKEDIDNLETVKNSFTNISFIDIIKFISNIHVFSAMTLIDYINKDDIAKINDEIFNLAVRIED